MTVYEKWSKLAFRFWITSVVIFLITCVVCTFGCTSPSQRIASHALLRGSDQNDKIVYDLSLISKQYALDMAAVKIDQAVASSDKDMAQKALEEAVNTVNKVSWLQIQYERSRSLIRVAQTYIGSQQGIVDILIKEGNEAKSNAEKTNKNRGQ